jgi:Predicted metalloprotease
MRLNGRRISSNVDDRRGVSGGKKAGLGIVGLIVAGLITWLMGGNPLSVLEYADLGGVTQETNYQPTAQEEELATFSKQILAGTEDVWSKLFKQMGKTYEPPKLVLFYRKCAI